MFILHIIAPTTPEEAFDTISALTRRIDARHHLVALGHYSLVAQAALAGIPQESIQFQRSLGWWDPSGWRGLSRLVKKLQPTHVHCWSVAAAVSASTATCFQGPRLLTLMDTPSPRRVRTLGRIVGRLPWVVTTSSQSIHRTLSDSHLHLPPGRLHHIPPGVEYAQAAPDPLLRKQLGLVAADNPVLLVGGPATPAARRDHALWAAAILQQIYPQTRVLIRAGLHHGASDQGNNDLVRRFSNTLPENRMSLFAPYHVPWSALLPAADLVLVTPDRPIPIRCILQAMAAGVPVLATALDPITELIQDNKTGLLAPPGEPRAIASRLEEFLTNPTMRQPLIDAARAHVTANFSESRMVEKFSEIYAEPRT